MTDEQYLDIAIEISKNANYPYGAIVVDGEGKVIGRSDNKKVKNTTPFCHPEMIAIQDALTCNNLYGQLRGCTMYVSCEPCPMCMGAILYEEFSRIVFGATLEDSNKYYCPEVLLSCKTMARKTKNRKIKIECMLRDKAVDVLKKTKEKEEKLSKNKGEQ